jgi:CheY-like chemotaxis protein
MNSQTILLLDDDSDLLQVVGQRCRGIGLNVQHARNLLTATSVIDRFIPDVICMDVEMPTGNGLRFCEVLRMEPRTAQVPVIVLTGHKDAETKLKCEEVGAHYIFKSADLWATLEPLVRRLMTTTNDDRPQTTAGIRPRNLPAHSIPPWPGEADAGKNITADAGKRIEPNVGSQLAADAIRNEGKVPGGPQVIVADDDHGLVLLLSERFRMLGCSVIGVHTALDAANAIHRGRPDLVVLDVNMPTGSGFSVCEMMATDDTLRMVPVIILTGCSDEKTIRRCHDMLVFYVQKGADIWSRIDPLVRELLHLNDAPAAREPIKPETPSTVETTEMEPPPMPTAPIAPEAASLMDAVFAMLGADAGMQASPLSAPVEMPWILCIDDDFDFSDALQRRFDEYGVAVARAANGMDGFCMAFSTPARAILLDYQMPNGQGDYILDRLKSNPVTRDIPVFMITGTNDKILERRMLAMGAAGYFLKPIAFEKLRAELSRYISALRVTPTRTTATT